MTQKYSDCMYTQKVPVRLTYPSYVLTCIAAFTLEVVLDYSTFATSGFTYIFTLMLAITDIVALTLPLTSLLDFSWNFHQVAMYMHYAHCENKSFLVHTPY